MDYLSNCHLRKTHTMNPFKKASWSSSGSFLDILAAPYLLSVLGNLQHHSPYMDPYMENPPGKRAMGVCLSLSSSSGAGWAGHSGASHRGWSARQSLRDSGKWRRRSCARDAGRGWWDQHHQRAEKGGERTNATLLNLFLLLLLFIPYI